MTTTIEELREEANKLRGGYVDADSSTADLLRKAAKELEELQKDRERFKWAMNNVYKFKAIVLAAFDIEEAMDQNVRKEIDAAMKGNKE